ncbi:fungal-specific transcription factor domain-containing protein [Fomitopsis serialis]|uniref:fungal-specific transcription factor domain-containing protein n=1 Tax=Fomitopsis serialis TaxID=139415 RepID=UPI002008E0A7|nr:fungal-specific transcription factor domain-containing protein [Neoantrodia serialis]KAH9915218.1 fungal-specific transcription factor domain-containing protein [Neoantrodia serialis]
MSQHQQWPGPAAGSSYHHGTHHGHQQQHHQQGYAVDRGYGLPSSINGHHHAMSIQDDYDAEEDDGLSDLPGPGLSGLGLAPYSSTSSGVGVVGGGSMSMSNSAKNEKQIRRRSSKACDQCRKSKCKCERSNPQDPCRNCVMLGTPCTFLGPSRKRGPPKGYIDAIEARLHQRRRSLGSSSAARTADPLAKEIIARVDNSPYGHKGRARGTETVSTGRTRQPAEPRDESGLQCTHPSNEWQDQVIATLNAAAARRNTLVPGDVDVEARPLSADASGGLQYPVSPTSDTSQPARPALSITQPSNSGNVAGPASASGLLSAGSEHAGEAPFRRQRRRLDDGDDGRHARSPSATSLSGRSRSPALASAKSSAGVSAGAMMAHRERRSPDMRDDESVGDDETGGSEPSGEDDELAIEVGQLSLNEDEVVRFTGRDREDGRHEGGIWKFPKARVWPPLPPTAANHAKGLDNFVPDLPDRATQELLLDLYWTYVHPALPIVSKRVFMEISATAWHRRGRVPTVLLLAMFSIAARYSAQTGNDVLPPQEGSMWAAGDRYLEEAKVILDSSYAASRPSTCQALLLMAYREVGIGAMAQAWLYVGMAVRMAQDLGLHKSADKWTSIGRNLFSANELQERRCIWYGCVVMDKYLSAYIGRPVAVFERDFDTELPSLDDQDEHELWQPHPSAPLQDDVPEPTFPDVTPVPSHIISCFSEAAKLSIILSMIMQCLYAIKPPSFRHQELQRFEKMLSKWYLDLPNHLRYDPAAPKNPVPLPHILTLHMQYWCTVLLLHRPFIRHLPDSCNRPASAASKDSDVRASSRKNYDTCVQAANHITSVVSVYIENYSAKRASVYFCYYVFTAAIQHVSTLTVYPEDAQARVGLNKCMDVLRRLRHLWPGAFRALELLQGSKVNSQGAQDLAAFRTRSSDRPKRSAEHPLDAEEESGTRLLTSEQLYRQQQNFHPVSTPSPVHQGFAMNNMQIPAADAPYQAYDRWSSDAPMTNYAGSLSTSVLPQQYSTGLVDERMSSASRHPERHSQRYPQFWNDYTALAQMDTPYGVPVMGDMGSQHPGSSQGDQQSMYMQDYAMFGNMPPANHP